MASLQMIYTASSRIFYKEGLELQVIRDKMYEIEGLNEILPKRNLKITRCYELMIAIFSQFSRLFERLLHSSYLPHELATLITLSTKIIANLDAKCFLQNEQPRAKLLETMIQFLDSFVQNLATDLANLPVFSTLCELLIYLEKNTQQSSGKEPVGRIVSAVIPKVKSTSYYFLIILQLWDLFTDETPVVSSMIAIASSLCKVHVSFPLEVDRFFARKMEGTAHVQHLQKVSRLWSLAGNLADHID